MISRRDAMRTFGGSLVLSRAEAQVTPEVMKYRPEIEPLTALFERTPRDKCAALLAEQLKRGAPYRQLMAAVFLAGIRNIDPRPPGFALHCVFVIHSAHLLSLEAPPDARLLPLFYALDNFKAAQERDARQSGGGYTMASIGGPLPAPERAAAELAAAMDAWDQERAERAVVSLARNSSSSEIVELLQRYGARDYRNIGHKAIYLANACRTLDVIGWQYGEPVLRSLVLALVDFGREQEVNGYKFEDQCYRGNLARLREAFPRLSSTWARLDADSGATRALLEVFRKATPDQACAAVTDRMVAGKTSAGAVWDAVHLAAAELNMRTRAGSTIVGIHAVTSANALRHAYATSSSPQTRFLLLLQAAGWMAQFRTWAETRTQGIRAFDITAIEPSSEAAVEQIFADLPSRADAVAPAAVRLARDVETRQGLLGAALRLTLAKADEVHYYKYLAALIEDIPRVNIEWQPQLASAIVYYAKSSKDADSKTMLRAREALG